jgi:hypothetical protein
VGFQKTALGVVLSQWPKKSSELYSGEAIAVELAKDVFRILAEDVFDLNESHEAHDLQFEGLPEEFGVASDL